MPKATTAKTVQTTAPKPSADEDYIPVKHLKGFQELHHGIPVGTITGIVGPPGAGKSTLAMELGIEASMHLDGDLLVFDTENSWHTYKALRKAMERKFDVPINIVRLKPRIESNDQKTNRQYKVGWNVYKGEPSKDSLNLYVLHCPDIQDILIAHGRGMEMKLSDKADSGKIKAVPQGDAWARTIHEAPFFKFVKEANVRCIVYDSLTNPLDEFTAVTENFPARTDMTQAWMIQIHKLAAELEMPVIMTLHESRNDAGAYSKDLKVQGGKGVLYNVKFVCYLLARMEKGLLPSSAARPIEIASDERALYLMRHPEHRPWQDMAYLRLTENGLVDRED